MDILQQQFRKSRQMIAVLFCELALFATIVFPPQAQYVKSAGIVFSASTDNYESVVTDNVSQATMNTVMPTLTPTTVPVNTVIPTKVAATIKKPTAKPTVKPTVKPTGTLKPTPTRTITPTKTPILTPTFTKLPTPTSTMASCDLSYNLALLAEINKYRSQNGKPPYTLDSTISIAACNHSNWMVTTGIFSHTGIDGTTAAQRCAKVGTKCSGENIIKGDSKYTAPANAVFVVWGNSAPHRGNLLGAYTHIGIGRNGNCVTVDFAF